MCAQDGAGLWSGTFCKTQNWNLHPLTPCLNSFPWRPFILEVVVSRLKGARLKIEENFTHDNFSGNSVPRDSTLKSRKFLELDSSLRPEATGTAMFESKSDKTVNPGMEGLPSPRGQTGRNTKLIPTRYSQLFNGPAEGSAQPHSQPCPSVQSLWRSQSKYFLYYCQLNKNDATVLVPTGQNSSQAISLKPRAAGEMPRALRSPEIDHTSLCASLSHLVNWKPAREGQIWRSSAHCCRAAGRTGRSQRRIRAGWRRASAPGDDGAAAGRGRHNHLLSSDREQPHGGGGAATVQPPPVLGQRLAGHPPVC